MELVREEEEMQGLKNSMQQSLLPLFYHMYDENQFVAEVRTLNYSCPLWVGCHSNASKTLALLSPSVLWLVLCPGMLSHLPVSSLLQASWETLLKATIFLKKRKLQHLLESEDLWRFGKCLVRVASKPQTVSEQDLCPQYPLWGAGIITNSLLPTHYFPLVWDPAGSYEGSCASPSQAANRAPTQLRLGIRTALRLPVE